MTEQSITILSSIIGSGVISAIVTYVLNRDLQKANVEKIIAEKEKINLDGMKDAYQVLFQEREYQEKQLDKYRSLAEDQKGKNLKLLDKIEQLKEKKAKLDNDFNKLISVNKHLPESSTDKEV